MKSELDITMSFSNNNLSTGLSVLAIRILLTVRPADANEDTLFYVGAACRAIGRDDNCRNGIDYKGSFARVNLTSNLEASHSFR